LVGVGQLVQHAAQLLVGDLLVVQVQALVFLDAQVDRLVRPGRGLGGGGGEVDLDVDRRQGSRDHEDDQQHQHHVDEGGDVDLVGFLEIIATFVQMDSHGSAHFCHLRRLATVGRLVVEVAADQQQDLGGGVGHLRLVAGDGAGEHVVDHHGGDRRDQAEGGGQQGFGDTGGDHGEVGGLGFGDADEAVHDAPD